MVIVLGLTVVSYTTEASQISVSFDPLESTLSPSTVVELECNTLFIDCPEKEALLFKAASASFDAFSSSFETRVWSSACADKLFESVVVLFELELLFLQ